MWSHDFWFGWGSSLSNSSNAYNSVSIRFCMSVWLLGLLGLCSAGNQYVSTLMSVLGVWRNLFTFCTTSTWLVSSRLLTGARSFDWMYFICSGMSIEKFTMRVALLSVKEWSWKFLIWTILKWFFLDNIHGQIISSSLFAKCCDCCNITVTSCSLYNCDLTKFIVCFLDWSTFLCGLSRGSLSFGYELLASFSCIEKDGKWGIPCLISNTVSLCCKIRNPFKGLVILTITMKCRTNVIAPTSNCNSVVGKGVSNCPLATMIWISGGWPSYRIFWGAICLAFSKSASEVVIVSISPSIGTPRDPLENTTSFFCF